LGGGTGSMSVRLAERGFQVVLLDGSEEMLQIAEKEAKNSGTAERISFLHADAGKLQELFEAESFDLILCHNLLEYVVDRANIVAGIAHVLRKDAIASFLVRNRAGEVLKAAIKSRDSALAKANLSAETVVDSLYGEALRVFDVKDVLEMVARAGLEVTALHGVRVFSDYRDEPGLTSEAAYRQVFELELILGAQPAFAGIARYTQVIAGQSGVSRRNGAKS
jgi:2-polyprenyl-3-methyl-5-hydroxy-6-metoxy-1,4-benzoquinol methylase